MQPTPERPHLAGDNDPEKYSVTKLDDGHPTEDQYSNQSSTSARNSKRPRTDTAQNELPRKKYVRGKRGGLQGIMDMPLEIFTEITYHITPGDMISLIRTNKFFRAMLLRRSALPIWQRAESNVPGLPPCPTGMCEPQYAALMFSKLCTLCAASAPAQPDPYLRVRLCSKCRDAELEAVPPFTYGPMRYYLYTPRSQIIKSKLKKQSRYSRIASYCLREEAERVKHQLQGFLQQGNTQGLREWEQEAQRQLDIQREEGKQLILYIRSAGLSRQNELGALRRARRDSIHEKLKAMGWEKELVFCGLGEGEWNELVDLPKPLTERAWQTLLPKLTRLLELNRARILEGERLARWCTRRHKIYTLLCYLSHETHPYRAILDALDIALPGNLYCPAKAEELLPNPFPPTVALEWDLLKDIYDQDISVERVEELFYGKRAQLDQKILDWRTETEAQLIERYGAKLDDSDDVILKIQGSTDTTLHLSRNARFLLRADTIFTRRGALFTPCIGHFPNVTLPVGDDQFDPFGETPLRSGYMDDYARDDMLDEIVKGLLKDIEMPDVAHVELQLMGSRFQCGRCNVTVPMTWDGMIQHYHNELTSWTLKNGFLQTQTTRHPVIFQNIHDLNSATNCKPLVHLLSAAEAAEQAFAGSGSGSLFSCDPNSLICVLCSIICQRPTFTSFPQMQMHMQDMHAVEHEPVEGIHYRAGWAAGKLFPESVMNDAYWRNQWDDFHEALVWGDAAEPTPSPSICSAAAMVGLYAL